MRPGPSKGAANSSAQVIERMEKRRSAEGGGPHRPGGDRTGRRVAVPRRGWGNTITPDASRQMSEHVNKCVELLQAAWDLDPTNFDAARLMLETRPCATRAAMLWRTWFERGPDLDPDDRRPYRAKLTWLEPKWYGSADEVLAFGRECAATGRWPGLVPMGLVNAHWELARSAASGMPARLAGLTSRMTRSYGRRSSRSTTATSGSPTRRTTTRAVCGGRRLQRPLAGGRCLVRAVGKKHLSTAVLYDNDAIAALISEAHQKARLARGPVPARRILWIRNNPDEQEFFETLGTMTEVGKNDIPALLADPDAYAKFDIVVWGINRWRETPAVEFTDKALRTLKNYVEGRRRPGPVEQYSGPTCSSSTACSASRRRRRRVGQGGARRPPDGTSKRRRHG